MQREYEMSVSLIIRCSPVLMNHETHTFINFRTHKPIHSQLRLSLSLLSYQTKSGSTKPWIHVGHWYKIFPFKPILVWNQNSSTDHKVENHGQCYMNISLADYMSPKLVPEILFSSQLFILTSIKTPHWLPIRQIQKKLKLKNKIKFQKPSPELKMMNHAKSSIPFQTDIHFIALHWFKPCT